MKECTTVSATADVGVPDEWLNLEQANWEKLARAVPGDLETRAKACGALLRRRGIQSALDLLRMVMAYAVCDLSLRLVGVWLVLRGLANISDVAILKRLQHCQAWLGEMLVAWLAQCQVHLERRPGVSVRIVDATGLLDSHHQRWNVHACFDLGQARLVGVELTDCHGGESLLRFPAPPNEILLADRGYAKANQLGPSLAQQRGLVVRAHWQNLRFEDAGGQRLDVLAWLKESAASSLSQPTERQVWLQTPEGRFPLRLIAAALPPAALERAKRRVRNAARKNGRTPSQDNLFAAGFILVLNNLPAATWSASQVLQLYRLRWQVELLFKRYKSIFDLDHVRAHEPQLVQTYLLAKLLAALWLDSLVHGTQALLPEWFAQPERPVSRWRLSQFWWSQLVRSVQGEPIPWSQLAALLPRLQRFLCDSPRRRVQQLAAAQAWLTRLSAGLPAIAEP